MGIDMEAEYLQANAMHWGSWRCGKLSKQSVMQSVALRCSSERADAE